MYPRRRTRTRLGYKVKAAASGGYGKYTRLTTKNVIVEGVQPSAIRRNVLEICMFFKFYHIQGSSFLNFF